MEVPIQVQPKLDDEILFDEDRFFKEEPKIKYYFLDGKCPMDLENCFDELLAQRKEDEIRRGTNLVGPTQR